MSKDHLKGPTGPLVCTANARPYRSSHSVLMGFTLGQPKTDGVRLGQLLLILTNPANLGTGQVLLTAGVLIVTLAAVLCIMTLGNPKR
jgi:hypothetical protein